MRCVNMIEPEAHSEIRVSELQSLKIVITRRSILETTYLILKWTAERQKVEKVAVTTFVPQGSYQELSNLD